VVDALGSFKTTAAMEAIRPLALKDESYLVEAEAARAIGRTRQPAAFETLLDVIDRPAWYDVIRAGALDGLAALRDDRATPHLLARVRYGHPARARRAAIMALPKLATDRKTRETLEQLLDDGDPIVRIDVVRALADFGDGKARPALREKLETDLDPRVRRRIRETLRDLAEPKRGVEPLREELEKLQGEHNELKARLAKLEARLEKPVTPKKTIATPAKKKKK
jgi:aminopeptidase N